jgi:hypothetical protein
MAANKSAGAKSAGMSLRLNWIIRPERGLLYVKLYYFCPHRKLQASKLHAASK